MSNVVLKNIKTENVRDATFTLAERSSDPSDPADGNYKIWLSDGTDSGNDGDIMVAVNKDASTTTRALHADTNYIFERKSNTTTVTYSGQTSKSVMSISLPPGTWWLSYNCNAVDPATGSGYYCLMKAAGIGVTANGGTGGTYALNALNGSRRAMFSGLSNFTIYGQVVYTNTSTETIHLSAVGNSASSSGSAVVLNHSASIDYTDDRDADVSISAVRLA